MTSVKAAKSLEEIIKKHSQLTINDTTNITTDETTPSTALSTLFTEHKDSQSIEVAEETQHTFNRYE